MSNSKNHFPTTQWSIVRASAERDSQDALGDPARNALESLCNDYGNTLIGFLRCKGLSANECEELLQAFFTELIERNGLKLADPSRGRFRSYLLGALQHFLSRHRDRYRAIKRGGTHRRVIASEQIEMLSTGKNETPERVFEKDWAIRLLDRSFQRLRDDYQSAGKVDEFDALSGSLQLGDGDVDYAQLASSCQRSEGALRVAVHRLRRRFEVIFRAEVARTLDDGESVDEEISAVISVFSNAG